MEDLERALGMEVYSVRFSKDPERRKKWVQFVNHPDWEPTNYSLLCFSHFTSDDFETNTGVRRWLKSDANLSVHI